MSQFFRDIIDAANAVSELIRELSAFIQSPEYITLRDDLQNIEIPTDPVE